MGSPGKDLRTLAQADAECNPEDLTGSMNDREACRDVRMI